MRTFTAQEIADARHAVRLAELSMDHSSAPRYSPETIEQARRLALDHLQLAQEILTQLEEATE